MHFADLRWTDGAMPDASGPVRIAVLPARDDGWFRAFVRFPLGWAREVAGHYGVTEEFIVLEGALAIDGTAWGVGSLVRVPGGLVRSDTRADQGCLAFAVFEGFPEWSSGAPATPVEGGISARALADLDAALLERSGVRR